MARTKQVYAEREIPHLWAHQSVPMARGRQVSTLDGRKLSLGRLFFVGDTIYSYGKHYPLARIIEYNDRKIVLLNVTESSTTTAKHRSMVLRACNHLSILETDDPDWGTLGAETYAEKQCRDAMNDLMAAKSKPSKAVKYHKYNGAYSDYIYMCRLLGIIVKPELQLSAEDDRKYGDILTEHNIKSHDRAVTRRVNREAKMYAQTTQYAKERAMTPEERIAHWRAGGSFMTNMYTLGSTRTMLRISKDGENVETSMGAVFPLSHAVKSLRIIQRCDMLRDNFQYASSCEEPMLRLGHYRIDKIENGKIYAGCHVIEREEVEHFAKLVSEFRQEGV